MRHIFPPVVSVVASAMLVVSGCGSGEDTSSLTASQQRGREVAQDRGCLGCHSTSDRSSIGPSWQGLAGSEIELDDGTTVVVDREYLERSIREPGDQRRAGQSGSMPAFDLSSSDLDAVIDYITALEER